MACFFGVQKEIQAVCSISNAPWHSNFCKGFTKKSKAKEEESYCKARVSRSENEIASYWYHNVLLGMPLNLVMGSEAINTSYLTDWYVGFTLKMESDCKAYVSWSENDIACYWYHNVLLEMPLYLVMGSEVKRTFQSILGYWTHAQITSFKPQEGRKIIVWQQGVPSSCRVSDN